MIRPIVKAAFKVDELVYQFQYIDVPDGYLKTGSIEEVNAQYDDVWIINEAYNRLDISMSVWVQRRIRNEECWVKDAKQLRKFIKKWEKK